MITRRERAYVVHCRRSETNALVRFSLLAITLLAAALQFSAPVRAEIPVSKHYLSAVVKVVADVPPTARTAAALGTRREGSGIVIDDNGLVLTIGYLILESATVELVVEGTRTAITARSSTTTSAFRSKMRSDPGDPATAPPRIAWVRVGCITA